MKYGVKILPRPEVLDTQGRAVEDTLKGHGHTLNSCRVGKYLLIDVVAKDKDEASQKAKAMVENGLYNPLVEVYELEAL